MICFIIITKKRITAYHPQCDGQVERTLANMLAMYVDKNQKDWDLWLDQVLFAYRTSLHESTGATPFSLMYGREARLPVDLCFAPPEGETTTGITYNHYAIQLRDRLDTSFKLAQNKLQLSQKRQAEEYDKRAWGSPFIVGDRVWLFNSSTPCTLSSKLVSHWTGPYAVKNCLNEVNYVIQKRCRKILLTLTLTLTLTVHHNHLKPCTSPKSNERSNTQFANRAKTERTTSTRSKPSSK